jgi:hypothetical protein
VAVLLKTPLVIVTDDDLVRVSRDNPGYRFEREEDGTNMVSPANTKGGAKSGEAFDAYDSNTGFAIGPARRCNASRADSRSNRRSKRSANISAKSRLLQRAHDRAYYSVELMEKGYRR